MLSHDLSAVRSHEASPASGVGARAYTGGSDIHVGAGQYAPGASGGTEMLGHELSHVVQQGGASTADIMAAVGHYAH